MSQEEDAFSFNPKGWTLGQQLFALFLLYVAADKYGWLK